MNPMLPAIVFAQLLAVDTAGMEPQLEIVRAHALKNGWSITCLGRAGDQGVLRLAVPKGTKYEEIEPFFNDHTSVTRYIYSGGSLPERCDLEVPTTTFLGSRVLASGEGYAMPKLLDLARRCGFSNATLRPFNFGDQGSEQRGGDWVTLDAGEDVLARYGLEICFSKMLPYVAAGEYSLRYNEDE